MHHLSESYCIPKDIKNSLGWGERRQLEVRCWRGLEKGRGALPSSGEAWRYRDNRSLRWIWRDLNLEGTWASWGAGIIVWAGEAA